MVLMQTFVVKATNRPGELATLTGALASKNVNILITALGVNGQGVAGFIASDENTAQSVLKSSGYDFEAFPTLCVKLVDEPGQTAQIGQLLGDQGVNIQCFLPVSITKDTCIAAIGVDNIEAATKALGDWVVEYTYS
jgi:hypothetical protein